MALPTVIGRAGRPVTGVVMNRAENSAPVNQAGAASRPGRPRVPEALLVRRRLLRTLDAGTRRPVTLICAGAGWGKTSLVASWAGADPPPAPIAWLTLDRQHDDPTTFWSDLLAALGATDAMPLPVFPADTTFGSWLARRFDDLAERTVLVLDDVHVLTGRPVLDGLARLLLDLPEQLRVILIGRAEPAVGLHRLRVAGDLTEVRRAQLAFRIPEATELLTMNGVPAGLPQATRLVERTEGWPVGLQLMGGSGGWPAGVPDAVRDYLLREVVNALPASSQEFLLHTSITRTICGELAQALTGEPHAEQALEQLERSNAFVSRTEGHGRQWFRYHGLLREVLSHEVGVRSPDLVAELHLRAARWYAGQNLVRDALRHAATARDWAFLARLVVERALSMAVSSDRAVLLDVLRQIPPDRLGDNADLAMCAAVLLLAGGDYAAVRDQLDRVAAMPGGDPAERTAIEVAADVMGVVVAPRMQGDMPQLIDSASRILARLGSMRMDHLPSLLQYRAIALSFKGVGLLWDGRFDQADRYLWAALTAARAAGLQLIEITANAHLAVLVYLQGSLHEAERYVRAVDDLARRHDLGVTVESTAAHLTQALVELERNKVSQAQDALRRGLHAAGDRPEAVLAIVATMVRAQVLLASDEPAAARDLLQRCRARMRPPLSAALLKRWLSLSEAEADLALGNHADVILRYAEQVSRDLVLPAEQVTLARAYELSGDYTAAEDLLARVREGPDSVAAVTAWVVTALIAEAQGHARRSADALTRAMLRADVEGVRRAFRRFDSERMATLAERQRWLYDEVVPVSAGVLASVGRASPLPADPLSDRERDVLRYLPTVLTANEIAADLTISVNTVKAHMRSIYRKLGAARRREAVIRARQTGLL
jgi:LuxR family maltose regulon positive regulatory protein